MYRLKRLFAAVCAVILSAFLFSGCGEEPALPTLDLYGSTISGRIQYIDGQDCRVVILSGDSHFDRRDEVQVSYKVLTGASAVDVGSRVEIHYDYVSDVSEYNGLPHITVDELKAG